MTAMGKGVYGRGAVVDAPGCGPPEVVGSNPTDRITDADSDNRAGLDTDRTLRALFGWRRSCQCPKDCTLRTHFRLAVRSLFHHITQARMGTRWQLLPIALAP